VGDDLLLAATPEALAEFRRRIAPPEMAGDEAIEPLEEKAEAARDAAG